MASKGDFMKGIAVGAVGGIALFAVAITVFPQLHTAIDDIVSTAVYGRQYEPLR